MIRVGEAQAREALGAAIRQACTVANVSAGQIQRTCVGLAGAGRQEISDVVRRVVSEIVPGEIAVVGDMVIALEAAFGAGPGVVVIAGTGSIAYGRNLQGQTARAGGWGFAISDEGSGHWIGRSLACAVMRAYDEGGNLGLLEVVLKSLGLSTREQLVLAVNAMPPPDFAGLLPGVLSAADEGDPTARRVLSDAGTELSVLGKIVIRRIFSDAETIPVAMSGGVFRNCALVRQVFYNSLCTEYSKVAVNANVIEPVRGALALARKGSV